MIRILFLAANPLDITLLRLDEEMRAIDAAIRQGDYRDQFDVRSHCAVRVDDLQELLLRHRPDIVHFSGHGSDQSEIILQDEQGNSVTVPADALSNLFRLFREHIRCVVLSACYADTQANSIAQYIDCVVGMSDAISDEAARNFATAFYRALSYGRNVQDAFDSGCSQIELSNLKERQKPRLIAKKVEPVELFFVRKDILRPTNRCDFYQHIPLPPNYVYRPELLAKIRTALLADTEHDAVALTSALKMDALHGMGGIGKSVIARALCDDRMVQEAFPDGILWTTLGQTPDLISSLREWADELGVTVSESVATLKSLKNKLAKSLAKRGCLLVIDDVWTVSDAEAFLVGGPQCRFLLTTRDAAIAEALGASVQTVSVMTENEAVQLLTEWAGDKLRQEEPELLMQIVRRLGHLPLAIKLAGGHLKQTGQAVEQWLETFNIRKLKSRRSRGDIHDSLETTFAISLDALTDADRRLYTSLAIFREDEALPVGAIIRLWSALEEADEVNTIRLLTDLEARALLQLNSSHLHSKDSVIYLHDQATSWPMLMLHDLLRDFISNELGEVGNSKAHQTLLAAYRVTCKDESWASATDDDYLYDHLVYHLYNLAQRNHEDANLDLERLFANDRWLQARFTGNNHSYTGYWADLSLAWQFTTAKYPNDLARMIRLYSIQQAIVEKVDHYSDTVLEILVELGRSDEALQHVRLRSQPEDRFRGSWSIYCRLQQELEKTSFLNELWSVALKFHNKRSRYTAFQQICSALIELNRTNRAEEMCLALSDIEEQSSVLNAITTDLIKRNLFDQAKIITFKIKDAAIRDSGITSLIHKLTSTAEWDRCITLCRSIEDSRAQSLAFNAIVKGLVQQRQFDYAKQIAVQIVDIETQESAFNLINAKSASPNQVPDIVGVEDLEQIIEKVRSILEQARFMAGEVNNESPSSHTTERQRQLEHDREQLISICRKLAIEISSRNPKQSELLLTLVKEEILAIANDWQRKNALVELISTQVAIGLYEQGIQNAEHLGRYRWMRKDAIMKIAVALVRANQLHKALGLAERFDREDDRDEILGKIAIELTNLNRYDQAEDTINSIKGVWRQVEPLKILVTRLIRTRRLGDADRLIDTILDQANNERNSLQEIAVAFAEIGNFEKTREITLLIPDPFHRADASLAVYSKVTELERQWSIVFATIADEAAQCVDDAKRQTALLQKIVSAFVALEEFKHAEQIVDTIEDLGVRTKSKCELILSIAKTGDIKHASKLFAEMEVELFSSLAPEKWVQLLLNMTSISAKTDNSRTTALLTVAEQKALLIREAEGDKKAWHLHDIVETCTHIGNLSTAKRIAEKIELQDIRDTALCKVSVALAQAGKFIDAENLLKGVGSDIKRRKALCQIAVALFSNAPDEATAMLSKLETQAYTIEVPEGQAFELLQLIIALRQIGQDHATDQYLTKVKQLLPSVERQEETAATLGEIVDMLIQIDMLDMAENIAQTIKGDSWEKSKALLKVVEAYISIDDFHEAERVAEIIPKVWGRTSAWLRIAYGLNKLKDSRASDCFAKAEQETEDIDEDLERSAALCEVVTTLAKADRISEAERVLATIDNPNERLKASQSIARAYAAKRQFLDALEHLHVTSSDEFLENLMSWSSIIEEGTQFQTVTLLLEVIDIISWLRPDWREVRNSFSM